MVQNRFAIGYSTKAVRLVASSCLITLAVGTGGCDSADGSQAPLDCSLDVRLSGGLDREISYTRAEGCQFPSSIDDPDAPVEVAFGVNPSWPTLILEFERLGVLQQKAPFEIKAALAIWAEQERWNTPDDGCDITILEAFESQSDSGSPRLSLFGKGSCSAPAQPRVGTEPVRIEELTVAVTLGSSS